MNEACTGCGAPATCRYDWGTGMRHACAAHDPLRPGLTATVHVPPFYQSLPLFPVMIDFGNVGMTPAWRMTGNCTCTQYGPSTAVCPVHQPAPSTMVIC